MPGKSGNVSGLCMKYGVTVLVIGSLSSLLYLSGNILARGLTDALPAFLVFSIVGSVLVFGFRIGSYGKKALSADELSVALLSAAGFSLLVSLAGILISGLGSSSKDHSY